MKVGKTTLGSSSYDNITLTGLGISTNHVCFINQKHDKFYVEPLNPDTSKVMVNGIQIFIKTELKHSNRVVLGHGNAFKVIIPLHKDEIKEDEDVSGYNMILRDRLSNDTPEAKNMRMFLEEIKQRLGEQKSLKFVFLFQEALDLLDEANEYTKARYLAFPLDKNFVIFTLEVMIDIQAYDVDDPEIAIRCRHRRTNRVIFLWRYVKFKERVRLMSEWYADFSEDGIINKDHKMDPWSNISDDDIIRKSEEQKKSIAEKIKTLKTKLETEYDQLRFVLKQKDNYLKEIEGILSYEEILRLELYIEIVIYMRPSTSHEDSLIMSLRYEKPEEFKQLVIKYHTECTRETDRLSSIHKIEEALAKLQKIQDFEEAKQNKNKDLILSFRSSNEKVQNQKDELKELIKQNNMLEKEMLKLKVEYDSFNRLHLNPDSNLANLNVYQRKRDPPVPFSSISNNKQLYFF